MLRGLLLGTLVNALVFPYLLHITTGMRIDALTLPDYILIGMVFLAVYYITIMFVKEWRDAE